MANAISDMLDGFVARKTDTVSRFGARLDTIADFVLVIVCLVKLLPIPRIPAWLYLWIGIIALIKIIITPAIKHCHRGHWNHHVLDRVRESGDQSMTGRASGFVTVMS